MDRHEGHEDSEAHEGAGTALTWLPGFAGLGLWVIATDKTSEAPGTVLSGRYLPQTAGPPQAAAT